MFNRMGLLVVSCGYQWLPVVKKSAKQVGERAPKLRFNSGWNGDQEPGQIGQQLIKKEIKKNPPKK